MAKTSRGTSIARQLRINNWIRVKEVRLIGANSENHGIVPLEQAMSIARDSGLDLVEVDPNGSPPVCRVLDYGKYKYQQAKRERDARKHQKGGMIHEVRMRPRIGRADMDRKVSLVQRLLGEGDKVKVAVMFRGREMTHPEIGRDVLNRALESLKDVAVVEKPPSMEGRFLSVILTPTAKKPASSNEEEAPVEERVG
ncbi:MAG: translation initiation factor IF-3 [Gemmatimonadota bacterium]